MTAHVVKLGQIADELAQLHLDLSRDGLQDAATDVWFAWTEVRRAMASCLPPPPLRTVPVDKLG